MTLVFSFLAPFSLLFFIVIIIFFLLTLFEEGFAFENGRESNGRHLLLLLTPRLRDGGTLAQRRVCFSSVIQHFSKVFQQKKIEMLQREQLFNRWKHS